MMGRFAMLREYAIELMNHWQAKNRYDYHGQRQIKDLKKDITPSIPTTTLTVNEAENEYYRPVVSGVLAIYFSNKTTATDYRSSWFCCWPTQASTLRSLLISYIAPKLADEGSEINVARTVQLEIINHTKQLDLELLEEKIQLTRFLNKYITERQSSWSKMHGVTRAYELTEAFNKCNTLAELDNEKVRFLATGKVGSDYSSLNVFAPSGTNPSSLRGELVTFLLIPTKEERVEFLKTPVLTAAKPSAAVAPVTAISSTIEIKQDVNVRDKFLQDLPTMAVGDIAHELRINNFDGPKYQEKNAPAEQSSSWWCFPGLRNMFG